MQPEDPWAESLVGSSPAGAHARTPLTTPERLVVWGCWTVVACLLLFAPVAAVAGLGAVWLVLMPVYVVPVLLGLTLWAAVRRRGRLPAAVWLGWAAVAVVGSGFAVLLTRS